MEAAPEQVQLVGWVGEGRVHLMPQRSPRVRGMAQGEGWHWEGIRGMERGIRLSRMRGTKGGARGLVHLIELHSSIAHCADGERG